VPSGLARRGLLQVVHGLAVAGELAHEAVVPLVHLRRVAIQARALADGQPLAEPVLSHAAQQQPILLLKET
jgi:hypothetical protein